VNFLVDMPLSPAVARWLRQHGHDAVHASGIALERASDVDVLARAAHEGRVVITADLDYPQLLWLARSERPGVILFRGGTYTEEEVYERLQRALDVIPGTEMSRGIVVVEKRRIRLRRLPLR